MIKLDNIDTIFKEIKGKESPDYITWRMELDNDIKEKIHAKRTTYN
tara:strand:+ start:72803 stop:72940 length:138 start_codon:yes stop_codon:yes gene_type:complete